MKQQCEHFAAVEAFQCLVQPWCAKLDEFCNRALTARSFALCRVEVVVRRLKRTGKKVETNNNKQRLRSSFAVESSGWGASISVVAE